MTLYHYTSVSALANILATCGEGSPAFLKCWWLFDHRQANDPREITFGREMLMEIIEADVFANVDDGNFHREIELQWKSALLESIKDIKQESIFIASFSELRDDLGQWRACGDDGMGVSIGLDFNMESDIAFQVQYPTDSNNWKQFRQNIATQIESDFRMRLAENFSSRIDAESRSRILEDLVQFWSKGIFPFFSAAIKSRYYVAEKEHRLTSAGNSLPLPDGPFVFFSAGQLRRHVIRPFSAPKKLVEVVAGPKLRQRPVNLDSLATLLRQHNFLDTLVTSSEIPYA